MSPWPSVTVALLGGAALGCAVAVHLAFLSAWPDHFLHEDSAPYLEQARLIREGRLSETPTSRPYGVGLLLAGLASAGASSALAFVTAQHAMSIAGAALLAAALRMAGLGWGFVLAAFLLVATHPRIVHYDNAIGAESLSIFLVNAAVFVAAGMVFRRWPLWPCAVAIGVLLGYGVLSRTAMLAACAAVIAWLVLPLNGAPRYRLAAGAIAAGVAALLPLGATAWNAWHFRDARFSGENLAVMSFVVGYSANFDGGMHAERKARAKALVDAKRAARGAHGWPDSSRDGYQWPFQVLPLMFPGESAAQMYPVVRDIFVETVTSPSLLWRHLCSHVWPEMRFLLFDGNSVARRAPNPQGHEYFVARDKFPVFATPTGIRPRTLAGAFVQRKVLDPIFGRGFAPAPEPVSVVGPVKISTEYDDLPGPTRYLGAGAVLLLVLIGLGWRLIPSPLRSLALLSSLLWIANGLFVTFLVYGLNRYSYYLLPYLTVSAVLAAAFIWHIAAAAFSARLRARAGRAP